jgi:AbrB family looped-hinge helix DNA binding protein
MRTTVSERGQVTIPKPLRDRLGIEAGTELDFEAEGGRLVGRKARARDPLASVYGSLKTNRSTDEIIEELRGDPSAT